MSFLISYFKSFQENESNSPDLYNNQKVLKAIILKQSNNKLNNPSLDLNENDINGLDNLKNELNDLLDIIHQRNNEISSENLARKNILYLQGTIMSKIKS